MRFSALYGVLFVTLISCSEPTRLEELNPDISVTNLKTESLSNPEGIDTATPKFSWNISSEERNVTQTAYQILVASSPLKLTADSADLWNSGIIETNQMLHVPYSGEQLQSKDKCYWKVKVWTNKGVAQWSESGYFSISLLYFKDWWGRWIGFDRAFPWESVEKFPTLGARYLRTDFDTKKDIKSATAYISGLGLYEMYLNGQKVSDDVLSPAPTDYIKTVKFNTYDVTEYLKEEGANAVGVMLGNGRYFPMRPIYKPYKIRHYGFPKLIFHLEINYEDGSREVVRSSNKWKGTADGPIRNNNEYDGEYYDARKEFTGWTEAGFDDSNWLGAEYVKEPGGDYRAQMNPNMKVMKEVEPASITRSGTGTYIMDMGQNFSGWVQMSLKGKKGQKVELRFAESLEEDGSLFVTNLRDAKATDTYILSGEGEEVWEPSFTYHGFRYVEISGYPGVPTLEDFVGKMVYDDLETVGSFESSNATLNQIYQNTWWSTVSNYKGMPVDCPQRNERQPWLADHAAGAQGENFMFANAPLYKKWLDDIRLAQKADGSISDVAPPFWNYYSDNMTWPGTYLVIAKMLYLQTGDVEVISENYDAMKRWLAYMKTRYMTDDYILTKDSYGDWCVPPPTIEEATGKNADVKRPSKLIATAYYFYFMQVMSDFAQVIDREEDIAEFQILKSEIRNAFQSEFYNDEGYYGDNKMTDNILPLYFGIALDENKEKVFNSLVNTIEKDNSGHLSTGLIGTQWLMRTLTENGRGDLAYQLASNTTYPSWGYMIENGATTIWELWHGNVANPKMNSQNHVMLLGDLIIWYYENLAGIKAAKPGFEVIEMKPEFDVDLDYVNASYESVRGLIQSSWTKTDDSISWEITIPANTKAMVYFPTDDESHIIEKSDGDFKLIHADGEQLVFEVGSGEYEFTISEP
ncbi:MAG: family 78 glycoside hydrolase catalytic domain [Cyclobacteriaceae bacterium]